MKIALVSYEFPPDTGFGGIGTYAWYQARALARLGHEVRVIAGSLEQGLFHSEQDGVQVTRVFDAGPLHGAVVGLNAEGLGWGPNRLLTAYGAYRAMRELLEHESYDMVEFPECGGDGMMISTMLPVRTCVRFHSPARLIMRTYGADDRDYELTGFLEQVAINQADVRLASSSFLASEVITRLDVPPPVHVVPNGIDLGLFDRDEGIDVVERFGLPAKGDAVTILFTSRLERRKGVHLLPQITLEILRKYPQAHFAIAGADNDGVLADTIKPQLEAHGLGDRLHYFGQLPLPEVRALVKHVDIHLLPTLWDNAPYACIEAMASGRAVLTSDCGGLPELIGNRQNGLLAQSDDAGSFVAALEELIEDRTLRERLGDAARRTVEERYTDVAVARLTVDVWRQAINAGS
jgi:glycosyltransferase involved in cell wall biosynthesis